MKMLMGSLLLVLLGCQSQLAVDDNAHGALKVALQTNGAVDATLDGERIPSERLQREGDHLRVLDESGATLYDVQVLNHNLGLGFPHGAAPLRLRRAELAEAGGTAAMPSYTELVSYVTGPRHVIGVITTPVEGALAAQLGLEPESAVIVNELSPGLPAEAAGLQVFDIITLIDGTGPVNNKVLRERVAATEVGKTLRLTLLRRGQPQELDVAVTETDDDGGSFSGNYLGEGAHGEAGVWRMTTGFNKVMGDDDAMKAAHEELERARVSLEKQLEELSAQVAKGGAEGDAAAKATAELEAALQSMNDAQASMKERSVGATPEMRFFNVGTEGGNKGVLLRTNPEGGGTQWFKMSGTESTGAGQGFVSVTANSDKRLAEMEARIAQLDARVAELVNALEASNKKP